MKLLGIIIMEKYISEKRMHGLLVDLDVTFILHNLSAGHVTYVDLQRVIAQLGTYIWTKQNLSLDCNDSKSQFEGDNRPISKIPKLAA